MNKEERKCCVEKACKCLIVQIVTGGGRKGLICQDNGSGPKNSIGPASNKQDQAFNGLARAGQLQNVFVSIATYIFLNVNREYKIL